MQANGKGSAGRSPLLRHVDCDRVALVRAGSVLIAAPLLLFPRTTLSGIALVVPLTWILTYFKRGHLLPHSGLNPLLLALVLVLATSQYLTVDPATSLEKVAGTVLGLFLFFTTMEVIRSRRGLLLAMAAVAWVGLALVLTSLLFIDWKMKIGWITQLALYLPVTPGALPGLGEKLNPNPVAGTLALIIPLLAALSSYAYSRRKDPETRLANLTLLIALTGLVLSLFLGLLTQSFSGWIAALVGLVILGAGHYGWLKEGLERRRIWTRRGLAAFFMGLPVISSAPWLLSRFLELGNRPVIWDSALMVVQDFPFTGAGMSTFSDLSERVYFIMIGDDVLTEISSAHNGFLQTAVDLGVPGLVTYVALWVASVRTLWILLRRRHGGAYDHVAIGCLGALAAAWVYQITDAIPLGAKVGALWWITLGIVHSLGRVAPDRDSPGGKPRGRVIEPLLLLDP